MSAVFRKFTSAAYKAIESRVLPSRCEIRRNRTRSQSGGHFIARASPATRPDDLNLPRSKIGQLVR